MTNALIYLRVSCHFKELLQMSIVIYISCISIDNFKRKEKKILQNKYEISKSFHEWLSNAERKW